MRGKSNIRIYQRNSDYKNENMFLQKDFNEYRINFVELTRHGVAQKLLSLIEGNNMYFEIIGKQKNVTLNLMIAQ